MTLAALLSNLIEAREGERGSEVYQDILQIKFVTFQALERGSVCWVVKKIFVPIKSMVDIFPNNWFAHRPTSYLLHVAIIYR